MKTSKLKRLVQDIRTSATKKQYERGISEVRKFLIDHLKTHPNNQSKEEITQIQNFLHQSERMAKILD